MYLKLLDKKAMTFLAVVFSCNSLAIDETESLRQRSKSLPQFSNISLDLSGKRGNSDTEQFAIGVYHSRRHQQHFGFIKASREYATSNGVESANNAFLHLRYNYYVEQDSALEFFLQSNKNDFRSLESRELFGSSYRFELNNKQSVGLGLFHEEEKYLLTESSESRSQNRWSVYWVYAGDINDNFSISNTLYYQPNVENFDDWRCFYQAGLRSKLTDHLYMKFSLLLEHDSQPVLDVEKTDIRYQAGFEFEF